MATLGVLYNFMASPTQFLDLATGNFAQENQRTWHSGLNPSINEYKRVSIQLVDNDLLFTKIMFIVARY